MEFITCCGAIETTDEPAAAAAADEKKAAAAADEKKAVVQQAVSAADRSSRGASFHELPRSFSNDGNVSVVVHSATSTEPPPLNDTHWRFSGKLTLGVVIASMFVSYYALLETACAKIDPYEGAGELIITQGGSAKGTQTGTRFPAPLYIDAGAELPANGTRAGELLWIEDLCDEVLDCSRHPVALRSGFNVSALRGKILVYDAHTSENLYMSGPNWIGRALGRTDLVGLGSAKRTADQSVTPGFLPKLYRLGSFRDSRPHDDDAGIPFPHFELYQSSFAQFLTNSDKDQARIRVKVTPTAPNPWRSTLCGYWKPLSTLLMLGHAVVVERAASNLIGHVRTSGLRLDLAQLALATEILAHLITALLHHDPFLSFHWAALPFGLFSASFCASIILPCTTTLLLAAFWYVVFVPQVRHCLIARVASLLPHGGDQASNDFPRRPRFRCLRNSASTRAGRCSNCHGPTGVLPYSHRGREAYCT